MWKNHKLKFTGLPIVSIGYQLPGFAIKIVTYFFVKICIHIVLIWSPDNNFRQLFKISNDKIIF